MHLGTKSAYLVTHKWSRSFSQGRETNYLLNISLISQSHRLQTARAYSKVPLCPLSIPKGRAAEDNARKNTWARRAQGTHVEAAKENMYVRERACASV